MADIEPTSAMPAILGFGSRDRNAPRPGATAMPASHGGGEGGAAPFAGDQLPAASQQAIIDSLVAEVERLRRELDLARHYENFLGGEVDRDSVLPVLNRRALLRAVAQLQVASEQAAISGVLLYLHIDGIDGLRRQQGLAAADAALAQTVSLLKAELRQTDLIGYIDYGEFAVTLAPAQPEAARQKAERLVQILRSYPLTWNGAPYFFPVRFSLIGLDPARSAEETLAAAERAVWAGES